MREFRRVIVWIVADVRYAIGKRGKRGDDCCG
jgi:hypothetical protein